MAMNSRLPRALERLLNELGIAAAERQLLLEIYEPNVFKGSRKGLIYIGLQEDIKMRLARVYDKDSRAQSAGYAYVRRCCANDVKEIGRDMGIDFKFIEDFSRRLAQVRDKTLFHIDKSAVEAPEQVWRDANIKWSELETAISAGRSLFKALYERITGHQWWWPALEGELPSIQQTQ